MPETLDFPELIEPNTGAVALGAKADLAPPDLTKIDLTDVALAMYGKWPDEVKAVKANLSTLVLDLSTPTKIKEARSLRTRLILEPLAAARKVSAAIKSKMAATSKAVGAELEKIEAGYTEADALILPKIEAREAELEAEREEARKAEEMRKEKHRTNLEAIRIYIDRASAPGMTAERIARGIAQLEALPTPTKEAWEEFAVPAANAICETLDKMRQLHAKALADEAAEAERVRRAAELAEQERRLAAERAEIERQRAELEAARALQAQQAAKAVVFGFDPASPAGDMSATVEGVRNEGGTTTITKIEYTEGRASQQVLKAEPATADATDRDAPAMSSPSVGSMGAGQAADAAPAVAPGPITMIEPAAPADETPTLKLGDINDWLGGCVTTSAAGLLLLGITHSGTDKAAKLYKPSDKARIKAKLIEHLEGRAC